MANVLIYDKATGRAIQYLTSVNTPDYEKRSDCIINPDKELFATVPMEYVKISDGRPAEMTLAEKAVIDGEKPIPEPSLEEKFIDLEKRVIKLEEV